MKQATKSGKAAAYYFRHARKYPKQLWGLLISVPITNLINFYAPQLILASVLVKLSQGRYDTHNLWGSFGKDLILYAFLLLVGILCWRVVDMFAWRMEMRVQQNIAK